MIKNKKDLAIALNNNGKVEISNISKKLSTTVDIWVSSKEIKKENGFLIGAF